MQEDIQHMWCCLDIAKHIRLARSRFFSLSRPDVESMGSTWEPRGVTHCALLMIHNRLALHKTSWCYSRQT